MFIIESIVKSLRWERETAIYTSNNTLKYIWEHKKVMLFSFSQKSPQFLGLFGMCNLMYISPCGLNVYISHEIFWDENSARRRITMRLCVGVGFIHKINIIYIICHFNLSHSLTLLVLLYFFLNVLWLRNLDQYLAKRAKSKKK